jgi:hypothetical protein
MAMDALTDYMKTFEECRPNLNEQLSDELFESATEVMKNVLTSIPATLASREQ